MANREPEVQSDGKELMLVSMKAVKKEKRSFIWKGRIALREVVILEGKKSMGKSSVAAAVAADATGGPRLDKGKCRKLGAVLWLTKEESIAIAVRARLTAAGADIDQCFFPATNRSQSHVEPLVFPGNGDELEQLIVKHHVVLVVIDPLSSFVPRGIDLNNEQQARQVMEIFAGIAQRTGCAFLIIRHGRKGQSGPAIDAGIGSTAIGAVSRGVLSVMPCTEEKDMRCLVQVATNSGEYAETLRFTIVPYEGAARIEWHGPIDLTADELMEGLGDAGEQDARLDAKRTLKRIIGDKPVPATDVLNNAKQAGIGERTIRKAKAALDVGSLHKKVEEKWVWYWTPPKGGWPLEL